MQTNLLINLLINGELTPDESKVAMPKISWATMEGSGTGCDMSVSAPHDYGSVRHVMVAH